MLLYINFLKFSTDEGEVFQVKKSSHSKKIMKLLDKERRKKEKEKFEPDIKPKVEEKHTEIVTGNLVVCVILFKLHFPINQFLSNSYYTYFTL